NPPEIADAMARCGWSLVQLDSVNHRVRYLAQGVAIHLGAVGKGYALDRAAAVLRGRGVEVALLSGGGSSVTAIGAPPGEKGWGVGVVHPLEPSRRLGTVVVRNASLSTSGAEKEFFEVDGRRFGHILDPRTGWPATAAQRVTVVAPTGRHAEAFSTAFAVLPTAAIARCCASRPHLGVVQVSLGEEARVAARFGSWDRAGEAPTGAAWFWEEEEDESP
ncbi:MAG: FAD:protein FMN transferase, partial [Armatimonadota bacterium]|nr:FAD:protein FMN transferase [Armatimonadota bacterium]